MEDSATKRSVIRVPQDVDADSAAQYQHRLSADTGADPPSGRVILCTFRSVSSKDTLTEKTMTMPNRCPGCGKPLLPERSMLYCTKKCMEKHAQSQRPPASIKKEVERLMEQYNEGGWKPEVW